MRIFRTMQLCIALSVLFGASLFAQQQGPFAGGWKLDTKQSDFGSEPAPKFVTLTILDDTPQKFWWKVTEQDENGKESTFSWTGPADGTMHPVKLSDGTASAQQSAKKEQDGSLVRHGEEPDGSSFDAHSKLSSDNNTLVDEVTIKSKDGKETKQKYVYHRATIKHTTTIR